MLEELLLPEDILQLDKLSGAIELTEDTSFLAIIGIDTFELNKQFNFYINTNIRNTIYHKTKSSKILNELVSFKDKNSFIVIDMFEQNDNEFIKDLLFYRDLISDNKLKIILIVNQNDYKYILKNAIDFYNINTFAYLFNTYKVDIVESVNRDDLDKLLKEYKTKKMTLSKIQKANHLYNIGLKYKEYGEIKLSLKYFNEALTISNKIKNNELLIYIKFQLSHLYRNIHSYKIAEKYLLDIKEFYIKNKNSLHYKELLESLSILNFYRDKLDLAIKYNNELYNLSISTDDKQNELNALKMFLHIYNQQKNKDKYNTYKIQALELANKLNDINIVNDINQIEALRSINEKDYKNALLFANKCIGFYKKDKDISFLINIYFTVAQSYLGLNDYKKSLIYSNWYYSYVNQHNLISQKIKILQVISLNYQSINLYNKSLDKLYEALKITKKLKLYEDELNIYTFLSNTYNLQKDYQNGLECLNKAMKVADTITNYDYHSIYARYSNTYNNLFDLKNAHKYYEKAIESNQNIDDISNNAYLAELYGEILVNDEKYEEALKYFKDALNLTIKINDLSRIISVEENLAYLYKKLNNLSLSKRFFNEVINKLEIIDKNNPKIKLLIKEII